MQFPESYSDKNPTTFERWFIRINVNFIHSYVKGLADGFHAMVSIRAVNFRNCMRPFHHRISLFVEVMEVNW